MDEVNSVFEYMDEEGLKEFYEDILIGTEELLDSYITHRVDEDSIPYEMPSAMITHQRIHEAEDRLSHLYDVDRSYRENELYVLFQLADIVKGDIMPFPTDKIVVGTGSVDEVVSEDVEKDPPRDVREGIRYRYYFIRESEEEPYALYKYEDGEWRAIGYLKDTLREYWHKEEEREEILDRILNGSYETPPDRVEEVVRRSWNRIHEND